MVNSACSSMEGRVQVIEDRTKQIPELFTMVQVNIELNNFFVAVILKYLTTAPL